jgi:hypothetical protein
MLEKNESCPFWEEIEQKWPRKYIKRSIKKFDGLSKEDNEKLFF